MDIILETDRLLIKTWEKSDITIMSQINADPKVMEYFPSILSRDETIWLIGRFHQHYIDFGYTMYPILLKSSHQLIGFTGLLMVNYFKSSFTPAIEIGWRISSEHWGKGYAPEAAKAILNNAQEIINPETNEIISFTTEGNSKSRRVMEKIGMRYDGDLNHPTISDTSPLKKHVVYKIRI